MKIKKLMTTRVSTCHAGDSVNYAAHLMWTNDCGAIPVVDEERRPIGMLTDRDVCMAAYTTGRTLDHIRVDEVMSHDVKSCSAEDSVDQAESVMRQHRVRRLPVVDSGHRLVGILSLNDLARDAAEHGRKHDDGLALDKVAETLASISEPWRGGEPRRAQRSVAALCAPAVTIPVAVH